MSVSLVTENRTDDGRTITSGVDASWTTEKYVTTTDATPGGTIDKRTHVHATEPSTSTSAPVPPFTLGRASKDVAFGSVAGMVAKVFEHPFDLVKVRLQTQPADRPPMYKGALDCFRQTYVKEGARGLFRGLSMPLFGATLENATLFFTYNFVQGQLRSMTGLSGPTAESSSSSSIEEDAARPLSMGYLAIAAACAGSTTSIVLTPVELIKCKMQVQMVTREMDVLAAEAAAAATRAGHGMARSQSASSNQAVSAPSFRTASARHISTKALAGLDGPLAIARNILQRDGIRGLWVGQTGTLLRETGGGVAWFLAFEWACRRMIAKKRKAAPSEAAAAAITKKDLSSVQLIGAGAMAGISYNVVLFPADSVKSTMQTEREFFKAPPSQSTGTASATYAPRGFIATFLNIYKTRGMRGLYAGCGVTCMRSAPSSALIFLLYNKLETLADQYGI